MTSCQLLISNNNNELRLLSDSRLLMDTVSGSQTAGITDPDVSYAAFRCFSKFH
jgi:hypothetical protein